MTLAACRLTAREQPLGERFINNALWAYAKYEYKDEEVFAAMAVKAKECLELSAPVGLRVSPPPTLNPKC